MGFWRSLRDGLSSQAMEPPAESPPKASIPIAGATEVYLRELKRANCRHWTAEVKYDAWGSPYVKGASGFDEIALNPDGRTSETWLFGTEWKHKSGPPVHFPKKPERPFDGDPS